jgi:hypothetical protein
MAKRSTATLELIDTGRNKMFAIAAPKTTTIPRFIDNL